MKKRIETFDIMDMTKNGGNKLDTEDAWWEACRRETSNNENKTKGKRNRLGLWLSRDYVRWGTIVEEKKELNSLAVKKEIIRKAQNLDEWRGTIVP